MISPATFGNGRIGSDTPCILLCIFTAGSVGQSRLDLPFEVCSAEVLISSQRCGWQQRRLFCDKRVALGLIGVFFPFGDARVPKSALNYCRRWRGGMTLKPSGRSRRPIRAQWHDGSYCHGELTSVSDLKRVLVIECPWWKWPTFAHSFMVRLKRCGKGTQPACW